jgi:hypothetical protein
LRMHSYEPVGQNRQVLRRGIPALGGEMSVLPFGSSVEAIHELPLQLRRLKLLKRKGIGISQYRCVKVVYISRKGGA